MTAGEAAWTDALVAGPVVDASGAVLADAGGAGVEFVLTTDADVIRIAGAVETRAEIAALAVVHARIADAAVGGRLATFSVGAGRASAEEIAQQIDAIGVVQTRLRLAETDVLFAPLPGPSCPSSKSLIKRRAKKIIVS